MKIVTYTCAATDEFLLELDTRAIELTTYASKHKTDNGRILSTESTRGPIGDHDITDDSIVEVDT